MSKQDDMRVLPELEEFSNQVGTFMEYWGFKRVHGQIWSHIYLSESPLDAAGLMRKLQISKALVSISLKELLDFGVLEEAGKSARGTRLYRAREDLGATILDTLRRRERKMMSRILAASSLLEKLDDEELSRHGLERRKILFLGSLIRMVNQSLDHMIRKQGGSLFDLLSMLSQSLVTQPARRELPPQDPRQCLNENRSSPE
jgi:DNA-binding transcriptional regulator GbsR (MarR family)